MQLTCIKLWLYLLFIPLSIAQTDSNSNGTVIELELNNDNDTYTMPFSHFRDIASSFAKSGMHNSPQEQQPLNNATTGPRPESRFTNEGVRLAHSFWQYFWNPQHNHFTTKVPSAETIGGWNGVCLWPYTVGVQALLEAEAARPGEFTKEITTALDAIDKFYSKEYTSYCAWIYSPGNTDIYYDDNAQVAVALLRAYSLPSIPSTYKKYYLSQAKKVINFLFTGYDHEKGGMHWHLKKDVRNACSTNLSAVAALQLAQIMRAEKKGGTMSMLKGDKTEEQLINFARTGLNWVIKEVASTSTGLIKDGAGGGPTYTYNTGEALHGLCLLYQLSPNDSIPKQAEKLALAAINRSWSLYDMSVPSHEWRYWWDNTFFLQLLVEGLVTYIETFGHDQQESTSKVRDELARQMDYLERYIKDKDDGLYWRDLRLYTISMGHLNLYKNLTGHMDRQPELQGDERSKDEQCCKLPVGQRPMVKTVLGNAGAARSLLIAGRIV